MKETTNNQKLTVKESNTAISKQANAVSLMDRLQEELKNLEKIETTKFKTGESRVFTLLDNVKIDIKNETNMDKLVSLYVTAESWIRLHEKGYQDLGYTTYPVIDFQGASLEDIKADIMLKKAILSTEARRSKLKKIHEGAKEFISKEQKFELFMKDAEKELENL